MRTPRVFVPPEQWREREEARITGPDAGHLTRVLRLGPGDGVLLLDGTGSMYRAEIREIGRDGVRAAVTGLETLPAEPDLRVTLVQALPKGDRLDTVVQKTTEIGVARIIPMFSERTVIRLTPEKAAQRRERWQRIATEAAEQCRRPQVPEIGPVRHLNEILQDVAPDALLLFPWEEERQGALKEVLRSRPRNTEVFIFIGPEGGFTTAEAAAASARGALLVSLGPRLLRTDTAGVVSVALVLYEWGDLGTTPGGM